MGSGKTILATRLGAALSAPVISLDSFIAIRHGDHTYASRIAHARLSRRLKQTSRRHHRLLIEGVCLRAVMRHLRFRLMAMVYIKRVSDMGLWNDGLNLDTFERGAAFDFEHEEPRLSDNLYHLRYLPHQKADFIVERPENDDSGLTTASTRTRARAARAGNAGR